MLMSVPPEGTLADLTEFVLTLFFVTAQPDLLANAKMDSKAVILPELSSAQISTSVMMIIIASIAVLADVVKTLTEVSSATAPRVSI
jgi:hypothetical protein